MGQHIPILVSRTVKTRKFKLLYVTVKNIKKGSGLLLIFKIRYAGIVTGFPFLSVTDETFLFIDDILITG